MAAQRLRRNLQDGGAARQALHLENIRQADTPQHTAETFFGLHPGQLMERTENVLPALANFAFVEHQLGAKAQAGSALGLRGVAAQDDSRNIRMLAIEQLEKL